MKTKTLVFLCVIVAMVCVVGTSMAARPVLPSNETSTLSVEISATAVGNINARTDMVFSQGNENLLDNPPLNATGEGVDTIGYQERTMAVDGSIEYDKNVYVDTGGQVAPAANLETERVIDYDADGDGDPTGRMLSSESVMVSSISTAADQSTGCCPWGATDSSVLPATNDRVESGSRMDLTEGSVSSTSTATTVAESIDEPVVLGYTMDVQGSNQTAAETAEGYAQGYVEVDLMEGNGNSTAMSTEMDYEQTVSADGLIELAMSVAYSSE